MSASVSPCGSYNTVRNWLASHSSSPLPPPPSADMITFFDNNQIMSRNWRVHVDCKTKLAIITMIMHMIHNDSNIQQSPHLSPLTWFDHGTTARQEALRKIVIEDQALDDVFRQQRANFIAERLVIVAKQQSLSDGKFEDAVDHGRDHCHLTPQSDPYESIDHNHSSNPATVQIGNPLPLNPNSYSSVTKVLEAMLTETGVGSSRSWTIVGCDGQPYLLASKIQQHSFTCPRCNMSISSKALLQKHMKIRHGIANFTSSSACRTFGNVLLLPGPGHYEINVVKGLFKLLWPVIIQRLASAVLGFKSPRALHFCQKASNHHKSWQIIQVLLFGTTDEIMVPYVRQCMADNTRPSVDGFNLWLSEIKDPNVQFLADIIFTHVFATHLYRAGMRRNNATIALAARVKFSALFFGVHMINYQQIELRDRLMRVQCPPEVINYIRAHEMTSVSGHHNKGEGGDFILEAMNRTVKMWMPSGSPDFQQWLRVCRNVEHLDEMHQNLISTLKMPDDEETKRDYVYHPRLQAETHAWRHELRQSAYLMTPMTSKPHVSIDGQPLDESLFLFPTVCLQNVRLYRDHVAANGF